MKSLISTIEARVGQKEADNAMEALNRILSSRAPNNEEQ